jgi:predicted nucleic acid-binding protein
MELGAVVLDTNVILDFLGGEAQVLESTSGPFRVSVITVLELLSYPSLSDEERESIRGFLDHCERVDISDGVIAATIQVRTKARLKLPDAIIAGTAIALGVPLLTRDGAFAKVPELVLIRP